MKTVWTKGLSVKDKEEVRLAFTSSGNLRERLSQLLQEKIEASARGQRIDGAYDSPNWAYKQADTNGYIRAIEEIISLIS